MAGRADTFVVEESTFMQSELLLAIALRRGGSTMTRSAGRRNAIGPCAVNLGTASFGAAATLPAGPGSPVVQRVRRGVRAEAGTLLPRRAPQHVVRRGDEYGSGQRADAALCSRGRRRLRTAVPADGTSAVSVLLASRDAPARGRRLFPGDPAEDPSGARNLPRRFQCAALGVRDFSLGLSRSAAVSRTPSRGSRLGERRGRT